MVHLCVSISNDGLRLESVQKGSPETLRSKEKKANDMATLRRQPGSRTSSTRQDRGSCSSTASCPVFSGPYSDQEEDPPLRLRRQSSPLLQGSLSSLQNSTSPSPKGSLSSLEGSVSSLNDSLPCVERSMPSFQGSLSNLRGSISKLKKRSLSILDNLSPSPSERSISPSLQSGNASSSDDDGSWDTNSWSSGATCLLRTPAKPANKEASQDSSEQPANVDKVSTSSKAKPEIIYQNLIFSRPAAKTESKGGCAPKTPTLLRKDRATPNISSPSLSKNTSTILPHQRDEKTEDKRKFSQFLNEVTGRVLKSNGGPLQQQSTLRHRYPSPPPPPPSTPSSSSHPSLTTTLHSTPSNPQLPPSLAASNMWFNPNLLTIRGYDPKNIANSLYQWSKTLPSCKILEPEDVLRNIKGESHSYPEQNLEQCTKIQAQPSTGRLYLETDIDRVRRLDELVANGTLGKERMEKGLEKEGKGEKERGRERENRIPWERNGGLGMEKGKEREKRKVSPWDRDRGTEKGKAKDKGSERPCWEKDRRPERGRGKEKQAVPTRYEPSLPPATSSGRSNPCPVFSWPEGFPRMSYRSTSLPRPVNINSQLLLFTCEEKEQTCVYQE
ncbi:uncharacterized protein LOC118285891 isoform X1 [Xyrichtys novacula]|uniref:Uncharacterized protein LOC118285891 isoform X1 n=1 Tax=Xyrichtys novacula TaxID=13765 RepID=A0AAV1GIX6_XYRNO|nr:uncharacterized protein LOC118285891 isoform X1 [Xyrichtys novacula]